MVNFPVWSHIMIHHSLTEDGPTVNWSAIRKYHTVTNKWSDIGYHFGVEHTAFDYECLVGRPLDYPGAHCKEGGMNHEAIGICVVGNYDIIPPNPRALDVLVSRLIIPLMRAFSIPANGIVFHRDYASYKSCPGALFTREMILERLRGI